MKSIASLCDSLRVRVECGELNAALYAVHDCVERIISEPLCTGQVFGSIKLDAICQEIGRRNLQLLNLNMPVRQRNATSFDCVYLVTKLQKSGGHTRILGDFIQAFPQSGHIILSTELAGRSDRDYALTELGRESKVRLEYAPSGNFHEKLTWLQGRLIDIAPGKTYLFNHHGDSVAVATIQPEMELDAWFYHHADHQLCLGVYLPHLKHIDPHPMGYYNCRTVLGIDNRFIPLVVRDRGCRQVGDRFMCNGVLTTCTAARSNKIEVPYFVSYLDVIPRLLHATGGTHIHIGRLTPWALFKIRRGLKRVGIPADRFVYIPWAHSVWNVLREFHVDLYIASFPYGGGLTLIEAMGAGVPVALHRHMASRILCSDALAFPGAFSWRYPDELIDYCSRLSPGSLKEQSILGREQYEKFYKWEIFKEVVADPDKMIAPSNMPASFHAQADEWAYWMEGQLSWGRLVQRGMYRVAKKVRNWGF